MRSETVIRGRAYVNGTIRYAEIGLTDGRIDRVGAAVDGDNEILLGASETLFPGFVDPHVHFRDPGMTQKEDFFTGSASAVCGGVTAVLEMPNTVPPVTDLDTLAQKKSVIKGRAHCDYGLFAALSPGCPVDVLADHVCGFKLFMGSTTGKILLNDDAEIAKLMDKISPLGKVVSVHAEDDRLIDHTVCEEACRDHLRSRPMEAEYSAIRRLSRYSGRNRINICHCTNVRQIEMAKNLGFTTEVALHHVLFDADRNTGSLFKVNPPIRDCVTRMNLAEAFANGRPDMVGTDHAPHTVGEKNAAFGEAPSGIPGVETTVPLMMKAAVSGKIPLSMVVRMAAETPATVFSMKKGRIAPGYDADFTVFDTRKISLIDAKKLHSKAGYTPYEGMEALFPIRTILRGITAADGGEPVGEARGRDQFERLRSRLFPA